MSKAQHTPGPWAVWKNGYTIDAPRSADGERVIIAVAQGNTSDELKANSSLIAAAPELLEALEALLYAEFSDEGEAAKEMARAALAKAKGEYP